jgi:hypothetical protein
MTLSLFLTSLLLLLLFPPPSAPFLHFSSSSSFSPLFFHISKMMSRILVLALAFYGAAAVPFAERGSTLDDPSCVNSVPATADAGTVDQVYRAAVARKVTMKVCVRGFMLARRMLSARTGHAGDI